MDKIITIKSFKVLKNIFTHDVSLEPFSHIFVTTVMRDLRVSQCRWYLKASPHLICFGHLTLLSVAPKNKKPPAFSVPNSSMKSRNIRMISSLFIIMSSGYDPSKQVQGNMFIEGINGYDKGALTVQ